MINTSAQAFSNLNLSLGDSYYGNANSRMRNLFLEEPATEIVSFNEEDFDNAKLQADGTYADTYIHDTQGSTAVCCGETIQQGCGDNAISYDFHDDPAKTTWAATLTSEEQRCNALDASTGKPHVWKTLFAR